jgi:RHS repeat-associated protein
VRLELKGGDVVAATTYSPYGEALAQAGERETSYGFTGEQEDSATGLLYLRARYYSSSLKTFMNRDPWEGTGWRPGTLNYYTYALNNPLKYTDPFGRCATDPYDEYADYYCWQLAYQLQDSLGLGIDFLSVLDVTQLQFLQGAIAELEDVTVPMLGLGVDIADPVLQNLSEASSELSFVHHLESGGWDVIGVRFDLGYGGIHGIDASFDLLFNFDALELSGAGNLNYTAGFMLGGNISTGVFIGFNAPTNDVFAGWGSGMTLSAAYGAIGCTIQWDVADRLFLLGNARPEQHGVRSDDPMNLAVMYSIGAEIEFSATLVGYSWVRTLYRW